MLDDVTGTTNIDRKRIGIHAMESTCLDGMCAYNVTSSAYVLSMSNRLSSIYNVLETTQLANDLHFFPDPLKKNMNYYLLMIHEFNSKYTSSLVYLSIFGFSASVQLFSA
jgi:hypothetical protein